MCPGVWIIISINSAEAMALRILSSVPDFRSIGLHREAGTMDVDDIYYYEILRDTRCCLAGNYDRVYGLTCHCTITR